MTDTIKIPETIIEGRRLGRHIRHDPASRAYVAASATTLVTTMHDSVGLPLDQGKLGSCTANALCGALNTKPDEGTKVYTEADAVKLYERETADEGEPYPPNDPGGSGVAVCTAGKELGLIAGYTHTFDLQTALGAVVLGPVIIGINWYQGFDNPDANGLVEISGSVRGGHEVLVTGIDVDKKQIRLMNSWGTAYGLDGVFWMSWDTLGQLLDEEGDVTVPVVNQPAPTPTPTPTPTPNPSPSSLSITITDPDLIAHVESSAKKAGRSNDDEVAHILGKWWKHGLQGVVDRMLAGDK
jgi:hypothetical protein